VLPFLQWIQEVKQCSTSTRNQRLAAIHAFCKYLQYEDVIHLEQWQSVLSIKSKRAEKLSVNYLGVDGIKLLLAQISTNTKEGRRDLAMIALLYDSGARVQELIVCKRQEKTTCSTLGATGSFTQGLHGRT
jgi:site-specific recombinase XerD